MTMFTLNIPSAVEKIAAKVILDMSVTELSVPAVDGLVESVISMLDTFVTESHIPAVDVLVKSAINMLDLCST